MKRSEKRDLRLRLPQATHSRLNFPFQGNLKTAVVTSSLWLIWYVGVTCEFLLNDWLTEINYSVRAVTEARWRTLINTKAKGFFSMHLCLFLFKYIRQNTYILDGVGCPLPVFLYGPKLFSFRIWSFEMSAYLFNFNYRIFESFVPSFLLTFSQTPQLLIRGWFQWLP